MSQPAPPIGLVPAAGRASRLRRLPCSKEILPVLAAATPGDAAPRPVILHLLDALRRGGAEEAVVVLRSGKWDIPAYLGDGAEAGLRLAYVVVPESPSVPATLDAAYPFVRGREVALGFPDLLFAPADAFAALAAHRRRTGAEVVLGLMPTTRSEKTDMVETDAGGRVRRIVIKQRGVELPYNWSLALWSPAFTELLHRWVGERAREVTPGAAREPAAEPFVSDVLLAAMAAGVAIESVAFPDGHYLDVGTPEDLVAAWQRTTER